MPPIIQPGPTGLTPLGPAVGASSEDDTVPAVQGTSLTHDPLDSTKWLLAGGTAVSGTSGSGVAVMGTSTSGVGVVGSSQSQPGVQGVSASSWGVVGAVPSGGTGSGVWGDCTSGTGVQATSGSGTGLLATSNTGVGLHATSQTQDGIQGVSSAAPHAGVSGTNLGGGYGLWAASDATGGTGVFARGQANAAIFDGHVQINGDQAVTGTITVQTDIVLANADCAEEFDVADQAGPGTVMVIDDDEALRPSAEPYDRRVAGVISGGGEYEPALILDRRTSARPRSAVALVGKVCCKVDADHGPVKVGDLLTTSPTPGHAMRASDRDLAFGAVIGKALQSLETGQGLIPILVALQ